MSNIFEVQADSLVIEVSADTPSIQITEIKPELKIELVGPQGSQGIPGPAGGSIIQKIAGETLSGHRAVRISNGFVYYCDAANIHHAGTAIGVSTGAALISDTVNIQMLGDLIELGWNWNEGAVFVGINGQLTQTLTNLLFVQQIGVAVNSTELNINPQLAVLRN